MSTQCILWSFFLADSQPVLATANIGLFNTSTVSEQDSLIKAVEQFRMAARGLASEERFREAFIQLDSATQLLLIQQQSLSASPSAHPFEAGPVFLGFIGALLLAGFLLLAGYRRWRSAEQQRLEIGPSPPAFTASDTPPLASLRSNPADPTKAQLFLAQLQGVILHHLDQESFSIVDLATEMQLSRGQLHRKVKAFTAQSPSVFMRSIRLQEARRLLVAKAGNTSEVAFSVGIPNLAYFSRVFKEEFGFPPSHLLRQKEAGQA